MSHWHDTTSVPGPVDPTGCCADQPPWTPATTARLLADAATQRDVAAANKLAELLGGGHE